MNKKLRNTLIALVVIIVIGLVVYFGINFLKFWGVWNNSIIKLW